MKLGWAFLTECFQTGKVAIKIGLFLRARVGGRALSNLISVDPDETNPFGTLQKCWICRFIEN